MSDQFSLGQPALTMNMDSIRGGAAWLSILSSRVDADCKEKRMGLKATLHLSMRSFARSALPAMGYNQPTYIDLSDAFYYDIRASPVWGYGSFCFSRRK